MKKILFIESWNATPHLETTLELAKLHANLGDEVTYIFCGHDTPYSEGLTITAKEAGLLTSLPENKGMKLIRDPKIKYISRYKLPPAELKDIPAFTTIQELMKFKYKNFNAGMGVASSLISNTKNSDPDVKKLTPEISKMLESAARMYELTKELIDLTRPDLIYVLNGRFCNYAPVMEAARHCNVKIHFHERGSTKEKYLITKKIPHDQGQTVADILSSWNLADKHVAKKIAHDYFINRSSHRSEQGQNHVHLQRMGHLPKVENGKRIVSYFSSSDDEYVALSNESYQWRGWENQLAAVEDLIEICEKKINIHLLIRLHPHLRNRSPEDQSKWNALKLRQSNKVTVISSDSSVDTYGVVDMSDLVITCGSTVGMEAVFKGKPSITIGPAYYSDLGATYKAESYQELYDLINRNDLQGDSSKALPFGYYMSTFGTRFKFYKANTENSGEFLGVNLQEKSRAWYIYHHYRKKILSLLCKLLS